MAADSNSDNPLDQLRLSLMQDVLPVGLAVLERARQGGPGKVVEAFTAGSEDPIADLRQEGEPVARDVREQLDACLLYTSPSPRDREKSRMPSSA